MSIQLNNPNSLNPDFFDAQIASIDADCASQMDSVTQKKNSIEKTINLLQANTDKLNAGLQLLRKSCKKSNDHPISACLPIFGTFIALYNERSLTTKISETNDSDKVIRLITIKNYYNIASIVREILSIALIVAGIALAFLLSPIGNMILIGSGIGVSVAMISTGCVAFNAYKINKNNQIINNLQSE